MFLFKILFCAFVLTVGQISFTVAGIGRRCFDCVPITSCDSGLEFASKIVNGLLPTQSSSIFDHAICGTYNDILKVCCSDFPDSSTTIQTDLRFMGADPVEIHPNIGLLPTSCGDIDGSRIVGGRVPFLYEFPWMALLVYNTPDNVVDFRCGASVINSRYILTAAHCVYGKRDLVGVRIGEFDYDEDKDCQGEGALQICESKIQVQCLRGNSFVALVFKDIEIEEIIPHPGFSKSTNDEPAGDDIALLRLNESIEMTNNAAPICLPVYSELRNIPLGGQSATIAGWGLTETHRQSSVLLKANIPILTEDTCNSYYLKYESQRDALAKTFCAGAMNLDSCDGDSGGPLMIESDFNGKVRMVQYGIVSYGPSKCGSDFPGVYTDVSKYMMWILDTIRE